jgi:acetyl-CoA C-acetyltransferase
MSRFDDVDPTTPVVVGAAEIVHRNGDGFVPSSATALMLEAVEAALAQTGAAAELGALVGEVLVPHGTWPEADPGRAIAETIGAPGARSVRSELGVLQHSLLARAAAGVNEGRFEVAIVAGGENRWSGVIAGKGGAPVPDAPAVAVGSEPDEVIAPTGIVISQIEIDRNLITAANQYAIIESAVRHDLGRSIDEHQRALGDLWSRSAAIAAQAAGSWNTSAMSSEEIAVESDSNRLIAAPYTKWLISQWNVDQSAALVFTTVGTARRLGIAEDTWVFPLAMVSSNAVIPMPERAEIHRWPASHICGVTALEKSGVAIDELAAVDLYSCFPAAVQVQARELGLPADLDVTVTGGMTFSGGPYNNYSLQGAAAMIGVLRSGADDAVGITTAVSGLLTKPSVIVWSNGAPRRPFATLDVSAESDAATERRPVDPDLVGAATVVGATVVPDRDASLTTVAVLESAGGVRTVAQNRDRVTGESFIAVDPVGRSVVIVAPGEFLPA